MDTQRLEFIISQAQLDAPMDYRQSVGGTPSWGGFRPSIYKFNADKSVTIPVRFCTGELSMGDPFAMKFFRGVAAYGVGRLQLRVYIEKTPVLINHPVGSDLYGTGSRFGNIEMAETPDPQRVLWLPRGTKGRTINIEGSGNFKHVRSLVVFWDALTGEEDG